MKASEYILELQSLIELEGDLDLVDTKNKPIEPPEYDEYETPVFVVCTEA